MKKILFILVCALMLQACEAQNVPDNNGLLPTENDVVTVDTIQEDDDTLAYDVPNASKDFNQEDLIYFIMIDRFKDGDTSNDNFIDNSDDPNDLKAYQGGDLQGIIDKLDYIESLGATTIWITPVTANDDYGYHGYWTSDFYDINPHFGDMATLKALVHAAHDRHMKVLLDYVVNHTGYHHPWTNDATKEDWFHNLGDITNYNDQNQVENFNLAGLPDLNTENPQVKAYFFDNALWWIRETGIDGMRLDTVRHVPQTFWNEFAYVIKSEYPDFFLLGEVWKNSTSYLESYHTLGIDSLTNYALYDGINEAFRQYGNVNQLRIALKNEEKFSNPELNAIFLDNHDVPRLISRSSKNGDAYLKEGLTFIMTHPSIPVIYYGTEIGLTGKEDPDNRKPMDWEADLEHNDIYQHYQKLLDIRRQTRDLTDFEILDSTSDYLIIRYFNDSKTMITAFNVSAYDKTIELNLEGNYRDMLKDEQTSLKTITLPAMTSGVYMEE